MHFHRAADDGARVRAFYDDLTDAMADAPYPPGWRKGVYPTQAFARCGSTCWAATSRPSGSTPGRARRGTVRMFYADTGWTDYGLYEYLL